MQYYNIIIPGRQTLSRDIVLKMPTQYAVLPYSYKWRCFLKKIVKHKYTYCLVVNPMEYWNEKFLLIICKEYVSNSFHMDVFKIKTLLSYNI